MSNSKFTIEDSDGDVIHQGNGVTAVAELVFRILWGQVAPGPAATVVMQGGARVAFRSINYDAADERLVVRATNKSRFSTENGEWHRRYLAEWSTGQSWHDTEPEIPIKVSLHEGTDWYRERVNDLRGKHQRKVQRWIAQLCGAFAKKEFGWARRKPVGRPLPRTIPLDAPLPAGVTMELHA